jgi:YD repeat-containing protein
LFGYDPAGQLVTAADATGDRAYTYDTSGRLTTEPTRRSSCSAGRPWRATDTRGYWGANSWTPTGSAPSGAATTRGARKGPRPASASGTAAISSWTGAQLDELNQVAQVTRWDHVPLVEKP